MSDIQDVAAEDLEHARDIIRRFENGSGVEWSDVETAFETFKKVMAELEAQRALVEVSLRRPRPAPPGAHDLWQKADNYARGVTPTPYETEPAWTAHLRECRTCVEAFMCAPSGKKSYCDVGKPISDVVWKRIKDRMS